MSFARIHIDDDVPEDWLPWVSSDDGETYYIPEEIKVLLDTYGG